MRSGQGRVLPPRSGDDVALTVAVVFAVASVLLHLAAFICQIICQ